MEPWRTSESYSEIGLTLARGVPMPDGRGPVIVAAVVRITGRPLRD
jgi:hypothetical protein